MPDAGFDRITIAQVLSDRLGLCRGFDDYQCIEVVSVLCGLLRHLPFAQRRNVNGTGYETVSTRAAKLFRFRIRCKSDI